MTRAPVLTVTDRGLFCPAGDFHIDPWHPVDRALITHGHADHARPGSARYLSTDLCAPVLFHRLGNITLETAPYDRQIAIGGATVSFHPAGHVPGSAQIRVEVGGEVWCVSGDYKTEADGLSTPFEPVGCHTFITECTFGLPVFRWRPQAELAAEINGWWRQARADGQTPVLGAYALGKAQRLLCLLDRQRGPVLTHGAIETTTEILRQQGIPLPPTILITPDTKIADHPGAIVLAPPSAFGSAWMGRLGPITTGFASGWMQLRGIRRRRGGDRGFAISDHADWPGLNAAIAATGAERVLVTHGYTDSFARWLTEQGYDAAPLETRYGGDEAEADAS
ncbi:ligase-associated DNA damage response exonuclease [Chachezhania sediminis]|uniref:ligase-associated DNA damage response exonuclease n=1 Tax=Chachezhania sediminis TaxID=2599291 RepID=UPI00131C6A8E|nr:ligase-associated DNA damage response exonuclease [Chachezhania sediminis]